MNGAKKQASSAREAEPAPVDAALEMRREIEDLDQRITRQQRRIERMLVHREGPADEMRTVLDDMTRARDMKQAQLEAFAKEER